MDIVKIKMYSAISGKGIYLTPKGEEIRFRHTLFAGGAIWESNLACIKDGKLHKAKWYHWVIWKIRRALWQLRQLI